MTAYWLMFVMPLLGVFMPWRLAPDARRVIWIGVGAVCALIIGLRHEVGADWAAYLGTFEEFSREGLLGPLLHTEDLEFGTAAEPMFVLFNWLSSQLGWGVYGANLLCGIVFLTGLATFARRQPIPWLAWLIAVPYLMVVVSMGYTRQGAALGIVFWGFAALQEGRMWRFLIILAIAGTMHRSALILMPLGFTLKGKMSWHQLILLLFALALSGYGLLATQLERYYSAYIAYESESEGALVRVLMNAAPAAFMLVTSRAWERRWPDPGHWRFVAWTSIILIFAVSYASTAVDRMALYLAPIQLYVWGRVPLLFRDSAARSAIAVSISATYAAVLWVWLNLGVHAQYWLPYRNVLFE